MPPWEILLGCEMLTLESSGGLVPGWSRECPMGVPLIVHILTLAGPGPPLLVSILALLEVGPIFAIWCSFLLIIFYFTFLGPFLRA